MTGTVTQTRTSSCQTANFPCSSVCIGGRTTERTVTVPLCCERELIGIGYTIWLHSLCYNHSYIHSSSN